MWLKNYNFFNLPTTQMNTVYCQNILVTKIILVSKRILVSKIFWWPKCSVSQSILVIKIFWPPKILVPKYSGNQNILVTKIFWWPKYFVGQNILVAKNMNLPPSRVSVSRYIQLGNLPAAKSPQIYIPVNSQRGCLLQYRFHT